jgi:hypothetical protein
MAATAVETKPKATKREQSLFSTSFDAAGRQRIKLAKPVAATILKARGYVSLLAKGCPALTENANKAVDALNDLTQALGVLGGLDSLVK